MSVNLSDVLPDAKPAPSQELKDMIYLRALAKVTNKTDVPEVSCAIWADCLARLLIAGGYPALPIAGNCLWPCKPVGSEEFPTHFGYEWEPEDRISQLAVRCGALPEVHAWVYLLNQKAVDDYRREQRFHSDDVEILDFTTGYFPLNCSRILREEWTGPTPPQYYWGSHVDLPEGVHYVPNMDATAYVLKVLDAQKGKDGEAEES